MECVLGQLSEQAQRINLCECKSCAGRRVPVTSSLPINFVLPCAFGYGIRNAPPDLSCFQFTQRKLNCVFEGSTIHIFIPIP